MIQDSFNQKQIKDFTKDNKLNMAEKDLLIDRVSQILNDVLGL